VLLAEGLRGMSLVGHLDATHFALGLLSSLSGI
jgi:hypothetical protein